MSDDRYLNTSKLAAFLGVSRATFYRTIKPRLIASGSVRILGTRAGAMGHLWHVGDVVALLLAHPYQEPDKPQLAAVGSSTW